jgi:SWI/SNF-related matrix-associated actin-dependent regulator 1 of chromatin subfamily A
VKQRKIVFVRIDGETPHENRTFCVRRFQEEPAVRVALLSIKVASMGLTLTAATVVIFAELSWNSADCLQA